MKPNEEQIKELWEWCGFRDRSNDADYPPGSLQIVCPNGEVDLEYPPIDLNNLFKWAVPKLNHLVINYHPSIGYTAVAINFIERWEGDEDPALALFWAIYKVMGGET